MLKTVFMGSPGLAATVLERLCDDCGPPALVVTQSAKARGRGHRVSPTAVEEAAGRRGIPALAVENVNAPEVVAQLRAAAPDVILVAAFGQLLKKDILELPSRGCLNVHASLLPELRGASPVQYAVWQGKTVTGISIQKMVRKLDAGDVLLQKTLPIGPEETAGELMDRLAVLGGECLVEAVRRLEAGTASFTPQDETKATYAPKIEKEAARLDWTRPARELFNQIRALNPWPVAQARLGGQTLRIHRASLAAETFPGRPGDIRTDGRSCLRVACGDGYALALTEVQAENRKRLEIREFLAAFRGNFPHPRME